MNTKSSEANTPLNFDELFIHKTSEERIAHHAQMISFRFLSEIEKVCENRNIKKNELAKMVGTSRSFITQLFRGGKQINTTLLAKIEEVLDLTFSIQTKLHNESHEDFIAKQIPMGMLKNKKYLGDTYIKTFKAIKSDEVQPSNSIVRKLTTNNIAQQAAG